MLSHAARLYPNAPRPFLDLSTGINPIPYPLAPLPETAFTRLPDAEDEYRLRTAAAQAYGVSDPDMVAPAPGTQILISLLPHLLGERGRVAILSPTYGEHTAAWTNAGFPVLETSDVNDLAQADIAIICNPNNPCGRRHSPADLLTLADRVKRLVIDEAFADLEPTHLSLAPHLPHSGVVILRSFGKSYGLAGLRLGFALTTPDCAARIRTALGPWPLSGPALAAGLQALPDAAWRASTIARLDQDTARLDTYATSQGLTLLGGTRLFRLYEGTEAPALACRLAQAGILVRRFAQTPNRLRLGLPGTTDAWTRLENSLP